MGLVHRAFLASCGHVENSKKAIRCRGWNPMNYNLLDDKELNNAEDHGAITQATKLCELAGVEPVYEVEKITIDGACKMLLTRIVDHEIRQHAREEALTNNEETIRQNKVQAFQEASRLTAGVVFNGYGCSLDEVILEKVKEANRIREEKERERLQNQKTRHDKIAAKVLAIREKNSNYEQWSANELSTMVSWYKRPGDSKMPTMRAKLIARYLLTCNRCEVDRNRLQPGEEPVIADGEDV